jgi:hypothetical protein
MSDPLAEVLTRKFLELPKDHYPNFAGRYLARAAREFIAAEIEAAYDAHYGIGREGRDGMVDAARIARGETE